MWAPETIEASESEKGRYVTKGLLRFQDVVSDENASGDEFAYSSRMAVLAAWVKVRARDVHDYALYDLTASRMNSSTRKNSSPCSRSSRAQLLGVSRMRRAWS